MVEYYWNSSEDAFVIARKGDGEVLGLVSCEREASSYAEHNPALDDRKGKGYDSR